MSSLSSIRYYGCDVSLKSIVVALEDECHATHTLPNNRKAILAWLRTLPGDAVIGMEATGRYHEALAECAVQSGRQTFVINPKYLSAYAKGVGQRGKTDPLDARVIARYLARENDHLHPYSLPTPQQKALRNLLTQRANIVKHFTAIQQSWAQTGLAGGALKKLRDQAFASLRALVAKIDDQLRANIRDNLELEQKRGLLQTICGIGLLNSIALAHRLSRTPFANSDAVVAAYGLDPRPKDSGNKSGRRTLTKQGNAEDRRLIYLAAQSAVKTSAFRPIYQSLCARGLASTEAIVIIARKLLRIAFAVWSSNQPFNPTKIGQIPCKKP